MVENIKNDYVDGQKLDVRIYGGRENNFKNCFLSMSV